jgi:hypothetical protein
MSPSVAVTLKVGSGKVGSGLPVAGVLALVLAALPTAAASQQPPPPDGAPAVQEQQPQVEGESRAPAYIAAIEGTAHLDREGGSDAAERGVPLVPGDRLRTEAGRVELAFPDGTQVYLDRYTELELMDVSAVRLARGRLYLRLTATIEAEERIVIDGPGATVHFHDDGEYRVAVGGADAVEVELVVLRGQAALASDGGNVTVPQGHRAIARDGASPTTPEWVNAGETALERWAAERAALWQSGQYASRQYLPSELASYASTFDRYGTWQNDESYGAVWYPSGTTDDWRPYYDGRWDYTSNYGWTWIAAGDVWAYPTHHYGRWHTGPRGWFWIPSRRWGAAWVYWAVSSDYVGWCPLGWNGRPVVGVFAYDRTYSSRWRDPFRAWTVVGRGSFGGRHRGPTVYADRGRLSRERPAFVLQHRAPGVAPPRSPYPSPFNPRLNAGRSSDRTRARGTVSTRSPRSYGRSGSDRDSRGGYAVPRGSASEDAPQQESPYERARPYMPRPETGRPAGDEGNTYRRVPSDESPVRSPYGRYRGREERGDDDNEYRRGGPGFAGPGYRTPGSPGMSGRPERDRSPGMSDPSPGERRAHPRYEPRSRRDDGDRDRGDGDRGDRSPRGAPDRSPSDRGASPRGDRGDSGGDRGGRSGSDDGGSRGGAVRRPR